MNASTSQEINGRLSDVAFLNISGSSYYQKWLEEKAEIDKHKWVLSEHAGHDVGWHYAQWDWLIHHRLQWLKERASGSKTGPNTV